MGCLNFIKGILMIYTDGENSARVSFYYDENTCDKLKSDIETPSISLLYIITFINKGHV